MWCILGGIVWRNQFYLHLSIVKDLVHDPSKALSKRRCGITATWNRDAYDVVSAGPNLTWAIWIHNAKCRATLEAKFEMDLAVMSWSCKVPLLFLPLLRGTKKQRLETAWETSRDLQYRLQTESPNKTRKNMLFFCGCSQCSPFRSVSPSVPWLFLSKFCPWKVAARSGSNSFDPFLTEVQGFMESETPSCTMLHHVAPVHGSWAIAKIKKKANMLHWSIETLKHCNSSCQPKGLAFVYFAWLHHHCRLSTFSFGPLFWWSRASFGGFPLVSWFASWCHGHCKCHGLESTGWDLETRFEPKLVGVQWQTNADTHDTLYPSWDGLVWERERAFWHVLYSCNTACAMCASSRKSDLGFICLCFSVASYPSPCRVLSQFLQDVINFSKYWWNMSTFRLFPVLSGSLLEVSYLKRDGAQPLKDTAEKKVQRLLIQSEFNIGLRQVI